MANVFISHRGADSDDAERLAECVRAAGHDVWLDVWELNIGDSIVGKINHGLHGATYLILCLSKHGPSDWMDREWMSTLNRQLTSADVRILPVKLTGADGPAILADIKSADLVADWDKGLALLLRAIKS
jgi:hypothetical protein